MHKFTFAVSAAAVVMLTACGGGGDGASTPGTTPNAPQTSNTAEGLWSGTTSNGARFNAAILENGESWAVIARFDGRFIGAVNGTATSAGGSFSGSGLQFAANGISSGSLSGTYTAKSNFTVTLSDGTKATATYESSYDQAPSLATIAGTYSGYGTTMKFEGYDSFTVGTDGSIRSGSASTCLTTGTLAPRASGKNVLTVSLVFSGPSCALGNGAATSGMAYYDAATRQLVALTLNNAKTDGLFILAAK